MSTKMEPATTTRGNWRTARSIASTGSGTVLMGQAAPAPFASAAMDSAGIARGEAAVVQMSAAQAGARASSISATALSRIAPNTSAQSVHPVSRRYAVSARAPSGLWAASSSTSAARYRKRSRRAGHDTSVSAARIAASVTVIPAAPMLCNTQAATAALPR